MAIAAQARIQKDLREINNLNDFDTPPIFARPFDDSDITYVHGLVVGPPDTPYTFGFFQFDMHFPETYPDKPPKVTITTTDHGRIRLNPNLYSTGKVCLSILGTWSGESADEWRSSYSMNYVLRAIQSLILTQKPYHNEPGFEAGTGKNTKPEEVEIYSIKITHEVLRIAVCQTLEECLTPQSRKENNFASLIKHYFQLYYEHYVKKANDLKQYESKDFVQMPFEYPENGCVGSFKLEPILQRLDGIKKQLEKETEKWKENGISLTKLESGWLYFKMLEENDRISKGKVELDGMSAAPVSPQNLFHWNASIFGPEGSAYDGGIFNVEIVFSDPDSPPRVKFLTKIWHPHITVDGIPFIPLAIGNKEPIVTTLKALQKLLKQAPLSSSATHVNIEAAKECFSKNEEEKKMFKKKVMQCVRQSVE